MLVFDKDIFLFSRFLRNGVYAGFTTKKYTGYDVKKEITDIYTFFGKNPDNIFSPEQAHSKTIIDTEILKQGYSYPADGIITFSGCDVITLKTADCLPVFLFSENKKFLGLIHLGWRSAEMGILSELKTKLDVLGINPDNLIVAFGPSICRECFEVGKEFLAKKQFSAYLFNSGDRLLFDLISFADDFFVGLGVRKANVVKSGLCTVCEGELFYSWRRGDKRKRVVSFLSRVKQGGKE